MSHVVARVRSTGTQAHLKSRGTLNHHILGVAHFPLAIANHGAVLTATVIHDRVQIVGEGLNLAAPVLHRRQRGDDEKRSGRAHLGVQVFQKHDALQCFAEALRGRERKENEELDILKNTC